MTQEEKANAFRALHEGEPFVIPNPWDAGSARVAAALGFEALASTSSGFAYTLGRLDGGATLDEVVEHAAETRPRDRPSGVRRPRERVRRVARGRSRTRSPAWPPPAQSGGSIEDYDPRTGCTSADYAVERVAAAVEAARALDFPFMLTARAENHIRGNPALDDTIARLQAFETAGADVLYAPGLRTVDEIRAVCSSVSKPVNVLAFGNLTCRDRRCGRTARERRRLADVGGCERLRGRRAHDPRGRRLLVVRREPFTARLVRLGIPARRLAVRHEPAEDISPCSERPVQRVRNSTPHACVSDQRAVASREPPAREPLLNGESLEQRRRSGILERQEREALASIQTRDGTRREAAEASRLRRTATPDVGARSSRVVALPTLRERTCPPSRKRSRLPARGRWGARVRRVVVPPPGSPPR